MNRQGVYMSRYNVDLLLFFISILLLSAYSFQCFAKQELKNQEACVLSSGEINCGIIMTTKPLCISMKDQQTLCDIEGKKGCAFIASGNKCGTLNRNGCVTLNTKEYCLENGDRGCVFTRDGQQCGIVVKGVCVVSPKGMFCGTMQDKIELNNTDKK